MTEDEIHKICDQYNIKNYTINDDMSIDVDGKVDLYKKKLKTLPLNFRKVNGYFNCSSCELTSLKGCPEYIDNYFDCSINDLTSLEYCPKYIGRDFTCCGNNLKTLQHLPVNFHIGGNLTIHTYLFPNDTIINPKEFSKLFFGYIGDEVFTGYGKLNDFFYENKNPPKKDLPRLLSELRKIQL